MRWGSILMGAVGLAVLDAVVSRQGAAARVGGIWTILSSGLERFLSPAVPAFAQSSSTSSSSATTSSQITALPAGAMPSTTPTPFPLPVPAGTPAPTSV